MYSNAQTNKKKVEEEKEGKKQISKVLFDAASKLCKQITSIIKNALFSIPSNEEHIKRILKVYILLGNSITGLFSCFET